MDKKLNFLLISKLWRLVLLKTLVFGIGLYGIYFFNFSVSALIVFSFLLTGFYFSQLPERGHFKISFLIIILAALFALNFLQNNLYLTIFACLVFSFLFYLLFGLTALIFKNRYSVYLLLNTSLFLVIFLLFFAADKSKYFLFIDFLLFLAVFLIFKECFDFLRSTTRNSLFIIHNSQFIALVFAFLALELFWAINLLPTGFINSAVLLTLFVFLMRDFTIAYFTGRLNRQFFIYHFLLFVVLVILIFFNSKWSI